MSGKTFLDTNILVYGFGPFDAAKSIRARELILDNISTGTAVISYQVLQEFLSVALKKFRPRLSAEMAASYLREVVGGMEVVPWSMELMMSGLALQSRYRFDWYDCLILAAALRAGCATLSTEDLQTGQIVETLTVINPF